VIRHELI